MLIAILTDLHANREATAACLAHADSRGAQRYVFLGDLVGYGADPGWVVDTVMDYASRGAIVVLIAHRTKAIEAASHLLVLNQGRMHAFGETKAVLPLISPRPTAQPAAVQKPPARRRSRARKQVADAAE